MIDIHSHFVFGVDDGASTIKESIRMVLEAEKVGIRSIIATPHHNRKVYGIQNIQKHFDEVCERVRGCGVDLFCGREVFITPDIHDEAEKNESLRLNKSRYLLFELPFDIIPAYSQEVIYKMHLNGVIPVIAHPERYRLFVNNFNAFMDFVEKGCLLQLDAASIIGIYGSDIKSFARRLIKLNMAHFVSSDAHSAKDYAEWYSAAHKLVRKWAGEEYTNKLFNVNPGMILKNIQ